MFDQNCPDGIELFLLFPIPMFQEKNLNKRITLSVEFSLKSSWRRLRARNLDIGKRCSRFLSWPQQYLTQPFSNTSLCWTINQTYVYLCIDVISICLLKLVVATSKSLMAMEHRFLLKKDVKIMIHPTPFSK